MIQDLTTGYALSLVFNDDQTIQANLSQVPGFACAAKTRLQHFRGFIPLTDLFPHACPDKAKLCNLPFAFTKHGRL